MVPTSDQLIELLKLKITLTDLNPLKYKEDLRTFERKIVEDTLTTEAVERDLANSRLLVKHVQGARRAMFRQRQNTKNKY